VRYQTSVSVRRVSHFSQSTVGKPPVTLTLRVLPLPRQRNVTQDERASPLTGSTSGVLSCRSCQNCLRASGFPLCKSLVSVMRRGLWPTSFGSGSSTSLGSSPETLLACNLTLPCSKSSPSTLPFLPFCTVNCAGTTFQKNRVSFSA